MAITRPDEYRHNNQDLAIADSDNVRGARRAVANRAALYALAPKADQLKQDVTIVRILSDEENDGATTEVLLVDANNINISAGWQLYSTGSSAPGGGGGASSSASIAFEVTQDGEQTLQLPATATGIAQVQKQTPTPTTDGSPSTTGQTTEVNDKHTDYDPATRILTISASAGIVTGQVVTVRYLYGSSGAAGSIDFTDITGVASADQLPVADAAYIQQLYDALKPLINQDFVPR